MVLQSQNLTTQTGNAERERGRRHWVLGPSEMKQLRRACEGWRLWDEVWQSKGEPIQWYPHCHYPRELGCCYQSLKVDEPLEHTAQSA